jgi:hypothetical protein
VILLNDLIDCARPGEEIVGSLSWTCLFLLACFLGGCFLIVFFFPRDVFLRRSLAYIQIILTCL